MNTYNNLKIYNTLNIPLVFENGKTRVTQDISSNFKANSLFVVKNVSATTFQSWYNVSNQIGNNSFSQLQIINGDYKVGCYIGYKENFKRQKFSNLGDDVNISFNNTYNNGRFSFGSYNYNSNNELYSTDTQSRMSTKTISITKFTNPCYLKPSKILSINGKGGCTNMFSSKFDQNPTFRNDIIEGNAVKYPWSYNNFLLRCPFFAEYGLYINSRYSDDRQIIDTKEVFREISSNLFSCTNNVLTLSFYGLNVSNPILAINNQYFSNFLNNDMTESSLAGIFIDIYNIASGEYYKTYSYKITSNLNEIIFPPDSYGTNKITIVSLYSDNTQFTNDIFKYVLPVNLVDINGYLVDGYYSGEDGVTEVLKQINIVCNGYYKVTINKFNDKLEYESIKQAGTDLYITNGYKIAPFFGFTEDFVIPNNSLGGLLKIDPIFNPGSLKYYSPIPIDLFSRGRFANVKVQLMNFSSAGFIGESLDLIRIPASGLYGKLIEVSSPFFEKFLPTSGQLQQLSLFLTDNSGKEIILYDPVYINFQIQVYEIINNMIGGVSEGNEIRGTGYKRTNYII
jgi:hypothetical protein